MGRKRKQYDPIACTHCGETFTPNRATQHFCSARCRKGNYMRTYVRPGGDSRDLFGRDLSPQARHSLAIGLVKAALIARRPDLALYEACVGDAGPDFVALVDGCAPVTIKVRSVKYQFGKTPASTAVAPKNGDVVAKVYPDATVELVWNVGDLEGKTFHGFEPRLEFPAQAPKAPKARGTGVVRFDRGPRPPGVSEEDWYGYKIPK